MELVKIKELKRIRLGNYLFGMRVEKLPHSIVFRSLVSRVADTAGVLNKFYNTDKMCMFMDFDDKVSPLQIHHVLTELVLSGGLTFHLFKTSESHYNAISPNLIERFMLDSLMKQYLQKMDYRFVYVYFRDGCNAMRVVPKIVDNTIYREISYVRSYRARDSYWIQHKGLNIYLKNLFPEIPLGDNMDESSQHDLILREYETINW